MNRSNSFDFLDSVGFFDIHLGLERMRTLLSRLGNPEKKLRFIHVAGSNGKGSVCVMTECALSASGFRVGFYSSPHLIRLAERFRVNGKTVSDFSLECAAEEVRSAVEAMHAENNGPTYFEITTAIALVLFRNENVDFAVWETGMGGRLDATNIVTPEISVITGISLEHTEYLGHTLAAIAGEKAGIIKNGCPVVAGPLSEEPMKIVRAKAIECGSSLTTVQPYSGPCELIHNADFTFSQKIVLKGVPVTLNLAGAYQRNNAAVAAAAVGILSEKYSFSLAPALEAFRNASWPARLQFVPGLRTLIDGAHNPEGAEALAGALKELFPGKKFHFISGCFADKDARGVMKAFVPLALDFSLIAFDGSGRKVSPPELLGSIISGLSAGRSIPWKSVTLEQALKYSPAPDGEWTVLSGSLHLCGEALAKLGIRL